MWVGLVVVVVVVVEYLRLFDTPRLFLSELCVLVAWGGYQGGILGLDIFLLLLFFLVLFG